MIFLRQFVIAYILYLCSLTLIESILFVKVMVLKRDMSLLCYQF